MCILGKLGIWKLHVLSAQLFCNPKTAKKKKKKKPINSCKCVSFTYFTEVMNSFLRINTKT